MTSRLLTARPSYSSRKSPRSVAAVLPQDAAKNLPPPPKMGASRMSPSSKRPLLQMHTVVSHWQNHCLETRNKQRARRRTTKKISFSSRPTTKQFDPEGSVLSLSQFNHIITDLSFPTPWYEQDYEELPWWEYPDLDEDDEITALCKQTVGSTKDAVYIDRVEALVWTAAVKLRNIARFVIDEKKRQKLRRPARVKTMSTRRATTFKRPLRSKSIRSNAPAEHVVKSSIQKEQVPSMFMGLGKEVQAERRRYKRSTSDRSLKKSLNQEIVKSEEKKSEEKKKTVAATTKKAIAIKKSEENATTVNPTWKPAVATNKAIAVKRSEEKVKVATNQGILVQKNEEKITTVKPTNKAITVDKSEKAAMTNPNGSKAVNDDAIAAYLRKKREGIKTPSSSSATVKHSSPPKPSDVSKPKKVRTITRIVNNKKDDDIAPTPVAASWVRSTNGTLRKVSTPMTNPTSTNTEAKSRIQKLKDQRQAMKVKEQEMETKLQEQQLANQRLETQKRRLERLKKR